MVIVLDQALKLSVHHFMVENQDIPVIGTWFRLHYILNDGMAFGLKLDNQFGKLFLSLFRIIAITGLAYFFVNQIKEKGNKFLLISIALILGGAIGNGIDSVFYGVFLDNADPNALSPWLHGKVIDMLYFPLFNGRYPEWVPWLGGGYYSFFSAIFNLADSAIFIGALSIIIFHNKMFATPEEETKEETTDAETNVANSTENQVAAEIGGTISSASTLLEKTEDDSQSDEEE